MVVLVDSDRAVKISIREWDEENTQYRPDWSADFFEVGSLQQVPDLSDCTDADLAELGLPPRAVIQLDDVVEVTELDRSAYPRMVDDGRLARKDEGEEAETSETYDPANPADSLSIADPSASAAATR